LVPHERKLVPPAADAHAGEDDLPVLQERVADVGARGARIERIAARPGARCRYRQDEQRRSGDQERDRTRTSNHDGRTLARRSSASAAAPSTTMSGVAGTRKREYAS